MLHVLIVFQRIMHRIRSYCSRDVITVTTWPGVSS